MVVSLGVVLAGCAQPAPQAEVTPVPASAVRLDVPYVEPATKAGAIAATGSVLAYYDRPISSERLELLETDPTRDLPGAIAEAVWESGLHGYLLTDMDLLIAQLDLGRPSVVRLREADGEVHYAVLVGYEQPGGTVYLHGPRGRAVATQMADFAASWRAGGWSLVVVPEDEQLGLLFL